jgi:catechol 2,3-dioxygenase-like lactoylglutathione lyase family enzyme
MKINALVLMLYTKKLQETVEFYTEVLGFECSNFVEKWGWVAVNHGEIELMFSLPNAHLPFEKPAFTGSFYFRVENADEVWEKIKRR